MGGHNCGEVGVARRWVGQEAPPLSHWHTLAGSYHRDLIARHGRGRQLGLLDRYIVPSFTALSTCFIYTPETK